MSVGQQRPAFVVAPATVDSQELRRITLALETEGFDQSDGILVVGLDVGLEAMELEFFEGRCDARAQYKDYAERKHGHRQREAQRDLAL